MQYFFIATEEKDRTECAQEKKNRASPRVRLTVITSLWAKNQNKLYLGLLDGNRNPRSSPSKNLKRLHSQKYQTTQTSQVVSSKNYFMLTVAIKTNVTYQVPTYIETKELTEMVIWPSDPETTSFLQSQSF
jgi:hypothetical protein